MIRAGGSTMVNEPISEEAFIAGFKHGYTNGRVAQLTPSDMDVNAKVAYRIWWEERQKTKTESSDAFGGAVIPVTGVNAAKK